MVEPATLSTYAKNEVADNVAKLKMGYVSIVDGAPKSYVYVGETTAISLTNEWVQYETKFEVKEVIQASVFFVNSKSGSGKNLLIDNVSLTKD